LRVERRRTGTRGLPASIERHACRDVWRSLLREQSRSLGARSRGCRSAVTASGTDDSALAFEQCVPQRALCEHPRADELCRWGRDHGVQLSRGGRRCSGSARLHEGCERAPALVRLDHVLPAGGRARFVPSREQRGSKPDGNVGPGSIRRRRRQLAGETPVTKLASVAAVTGRRSLTAVHEERGVASPNEQ
jgi:hypothetical protein